MQNEAVNTVASPDLEAVATMADYRALREGRAVTAAADAVETQHADAGAAGAADAINTVADAVTPGDDSNESETHKQGPKKDKLQARFSELTAKIKTLESELSQARTVATGKPDATKPAAAAAADDVTPGADPKPDQAKFTDYGDYQEALISWHVRDAQRTTKATELTQAKQEAATVRAQTWDARIGEAKAELSDFDTVALNPDLTISNTMGEAIVESEIGARVLYHLGQNPAEAARIAKLSPVAQIREIGKLEAKLETSAAPAVTPTKATPVSKAPAPIKPVSGASAAASNASPAARIDSMSQSEYRALRESGKLR